MTANDSVLLSRSTVMSRLFRDETDQVSCKKLDCTPKTEVLQSTFNPTKLLTNSKEEL